MILNFTNKTNLLLRRFALALALILLSFNIVFAQLFPISLDQRIDQATTILEGKVIGQTSYWDESQTHIYTSNIVEVYKVFKGQLTGKQAEIITRGGIVGNKMERVSNTLALNLGDIGIFTAVSNTTKVITKANLTKLKAFAGMQGFIKYNLINRSAKDVFNDYKDIVKELHSKIITQTKTEIKTIQLAPFKI